MNRLKRLGGLLLMFAAMMLMAPAVSAETGAEDTGPPLQEDAGATSGDATSGDTSDIGMSDADGGDAATADSGADVGQDDAGDAASEAPDGGETIDTEDDDEGCSTSGMAATPGSDLALLLSAVLVLGVRSRSRYDGAARR